MSWKLDSVKQIVNTNRMKLLALLLLVAAVTAAPSVEKKIDISELASLEGFLTDSSPESRNFLINALVRQLINYIRNVINEGSSIFGIPPLDPLILERFHLNVPAGIVNLDLELEDVYATGFGGFVVHRSNLNLRQLTFDIDISVPNIKVQAGKYDLLGDLMTAVPIYGSGEAFFSVENFRFQAVLHLKQSDDGQSVLIDKVEGATFQLPHFKSHLTGVIGGGDIDAVVNAVIEEVLIDYINRFHGAISLLVSNAVVFAANPVLDRLNTWRFIAPFV